MTFELASSIGTPFQADTIFGHICWALNYREGEGALRDFLAAYDDTPPLLVSDGFPVLGDRYYLPRPATPASPKAFGSVSASLGIDERDVATQRMFFTALKALEKKAYIETSALLSHSDPLNMAALARDCFQLRLCPGSMAPADKACCKCKNWMECPALETGTDSSYKCEFDYPRQTDAPIMHNVINRWTCASVNLFVQNEMFPSSGFHFFARVDEDVMGLNRLESCLRYIEHSGYGRDKSTGKGALKNLRIEDYSLPDAAAMSAFINLSSAYVPQPGELKGGCYAVHVKRGKLGGGYVLKHSPWKKPVLMLKAGAVLAGDPLATHGALVKGIHYELEDVVQYGYAYPLGVTVDETAF